MTSVRKKASSEIFRMPRWLRGLPRSLRSVMNPEELSMYRRMGKAVIQELRPKTPIEWILVDEFVNAQFSAMRYGTWQAAVMQFSVGEGLRRAVKNRLRSDNEGSEADLDWKAKKLLGSMRPYVNDQPLKLRCAYLEEAIWTAFIKDNSVLNAAVLVTGREPSVTAYAFTLVDHPIS